MRSRRAFGRGSRLVAAGAIGAAAATAHLLVNRRGLVVPPPPSDAPRALVSVLVPARNEATRIGPVVSAVLSSTDVDLELVVVDDGSTDATAEVVRRAARGDPRLRLVAAEALPEGWLGKPHACAQAAAAARGDVLVFCDADVVVAPDGIARTVAAITGGGIDVASPYPRQLALSGGERLVQPLLQWSWLAFLPLRLALRSPRPALTAANGQLVACRRATYEAIGGHAVVRADVLDDIALARVAKTAGYRAGVIDGTAVATCRMYRSWTEVRDGYAKSLWSAFGSPGGALGAISALAWLFVVPPVAAILGILRGDRRLATIGGAGYAAAVAGRAIAAAHTGGRVGDAWQHPGSVAVLAWLTARSWWQHRRGRLTWRGRPVTPS